MAFMDAPLDHASSLTLGRFSIARGILLVLAATMIGLSFYLSYHYFSIHFPDSLVATSLCDISAFWNCDVATLSPLAQLGPLPTAAFGIVVGWLLMLAACFASRQAEAAAYLLAILNALGCLVFLSYSLLVLSGLCPGCVAYYVCSFIVLLLFLAKSSLRPQLSVRPVLVALVSAGLILGVFAYQIKEKQGKIDEVAQKFISDLEGSADYEAFGFTSPFVLAQATEKFADAPLRVSIFSDFQCPICRVFADMLPKIIRHFKGQLNMQYFFYPLDNACNPQVTQTFHPMACEAAYVAACAGDKFGTVHDELYANQEKFTKPWLQQLANRYELSVCYHAETPAKVVAHMLQAGDKVGVKATPTILINGKKLEGLLPLKMLVMMMELELEKGKKAQTAPSH
jgi:protein-disulfide isomerase